VPWQHAGVDILGMGHAGLKYDGWARGWMLLSGELLMIKLGMDWIHCRFIPAAASMLAPFNGSDIVETGVAYEDAMHWTQSFPTIGDKRLSVNPANIRRALMKADYSRGRC